MKKSILVILMVLTVFGINTVLMDVSQIIGNAEAAELNWVGCGISKKAYMKEMAAAYEKKTGVNIVIKGGGATKGIRSVAAGLADVGGTCRHKIDVPEEADAMMHHVAWDALVVIANKDNPVDTISVDQIKKVLVGDIKNWKDLGGSDEPLTLFVRKGKKGGVGMMVREMVFNDRNQDFSPDAKVKKSSGPLEKSIGGMTSGIGISGISSAKKNKKLKILKVGGMAPTKENISSGKYVLHRPLYLTTKGKPSGEVKKFINFVLSEEGQDIISKQGTVNLEEGKALKIK